MTRRGLFVVTLLAAAVSAPVLAVDESERSTVRRIARRRLETALDVWFPADSALSTDAVAEALGWIRRVRGAAGHPAGPPGAPSTSSVRNVCTLSTTQTDGRSRSRRPATARVSVLSSRNSESAARPRRRARSATCGGASSPAM